MSQTAHFKVVRDGDDWMVVDATIGSYSFAMIVSEIGLCGSKQEAIEEMNKIFGRTVETRMIDTPDRFETVADTVYGPAWE